MIPFHRRAAPAVLAAAACLAASAASAQTAAPPAAPNWMVNCVNSGADGALRCSMSRSVVPTANGARLISVEITRAPDAEQPAMMVTLPLGLFLPAGLRMAVDGVARDPLAIQTCDAKGCHAGHGVAPALLAALQSGGAFTFVIRDLSRRDIELPLKLEGFAAAYANLR